MRCIPDGCVQYLPGIHGRNAIAEGPHSYRMSNYLPAMRAKVRSVSNTF